MSSLAALRRDLRMEANPAKARVLQRFFKTAPGEYGEGDVFLGVVVPVIRRLARQYRALPLGDVLKLLASALHEERLLALLLMVQQYRKEDEAGRNKIYQAYLKNRSRINNWDLIDTSAEHIVGAQLADASGEHEVLTRFARSGNLWERRIAIMATFHFIRKGSFDETLRIAGILLHDEEDLIHKAVGWMLREVGKRDRAAEERFLKKTYSVMPRTMLRYAIEKFPEVRRKAYLNGTV